MLGLSKGINLVQSAAIFSNVSVVKHIAGKHFCLISASFLEETAHLIYLFFLH